jgi:uncharacterized protein YjbI with pentapeptide repeats
MGTIGKRVLWGVVAVALMTAAVLIGYRYDITLWDWVKLLIVPAVIAGGGLWFNAQQREREQQIANDRAQDEALQAYLDGMSQLLTDKERPLYKTQRGDRLSIIARARTLSVLGRLDSSRKRSVLQFLYESGLIAKDRAVIDLRGADLSKARLIGLNLSQADLSEANLSQANLSEASLRRADLSEAKLGEADLQYARVGSPRDTFFEQTLFGATRNKLGSLLTTTRSRWQRILPPANLSQANLSKAHLTYTDLRRVNLGQADLSDAKLNEADLKDANLREANLYRANLWRTSLNSADLREANLFQADLGGTELRQDVFIIRWRLPGFWEKRARRGEVMRLGGATMPNGQKYEDWLKSKDRAEDG